MNISGLKNRVIDLVKHRDAVERQPLGATVRPPAWLTDSNANGPDAGGARLSTPSLPGAERIAQRDPYAAPPSLAASWKWGGSRAEHFTFLGNKEHPLPADAKIPAGIAEEFNGISAKIGSLSDVALWRSNDGQGFVLQWDEYVNNMRNEKFFDAAGTQLGEAERNRLPSGE